MPESLEPSAAAPRQEWLLGSVLAALACAAVAIVAFAETRAQTVDDMFILLVNVKHLALGNGIYWNAQDGHVDGCTSFLDLILKAIAYRVSGTDGLQVNFQVTRLLVAAVPAIGVGAMAWLSRSDRASRAAPSLLLTGLLLATNPAVAEGSAYLLETPLYVGTGLLLLGTFLAAHRFTTRIMAVLVAEALLVSLARPEGVLLGMVILLASALDPRRAPASRHRWWGLAMFAGLLALYYAWHTAYFGFWAPNTYYAKKSSVRLHEIEDGLAYVVHYLRTWRGCVTMAPSLLVFIVAARGGVPKEARYTLSVIALAIAAVLGGIIVGGGDSYSGGRFMALPTALGAIGLIVAWREATGTLRTGLLAAATLLAVVQTATVAAAFSDARQRMAKWPLTDRTYGCVGLFADALDRAVPGGSVAETDYQIIKYYADDLRVIDLYGLSDREIAHRVETGHVRWGKLDLHDVVRRRPDAFLWGTTPARNRAMSAAPMRSILTDFHTRRYFTRAEEPLPTDIAEELEESYLPASIPFCGKQYNVFVRKEVASRFAQAGFTLGTTE